MEITYQTRYNAGSCNYCNKGKLSVSGTNLVYPYTHVFKLTGNHIAITMCEECLNNVFKFRDKIISELVFDKLVEENG